MKHNHPTASSYSPSHGGYPNNPPPTDTTTGFANDDVEDIAEQIVSLSKDEVKQLKNYLESKGITVIS